MQHYLVTQSHYGFGWAVFAVAMAAFFFIESRMKQDLAPGPARSVEAPRLVPAARAVAIAALAFTLCIPLALRAATSRPALATSALELPRDPGAWRGPTPLADGWQPLQQGADVERLGGYAGPGDHPAQAYSAWYLTQHQGKELGGEGNGAAAQFAVLATEVVSAGGRTHVEQQVRDERRREWIIAYTYEVDARAFTSATLAQVWYSLRSIASLRPPLSRVLAVRAECDGDCAAARATARDLLSTLRSHSRDS
jgi:EpsI family protein